MSIAVDPRSTQAQSVPARGDDNSFRDFLLSALRCGSLRARLLANELNTIGVALKGQMMSPEDAIEAINDLDAWTLIPELAEGPAQ
jgi:hypothetical protein